MQFLKNPCFRSHRLFSLLFMPYYIIYFANYCPVSLSALLDFVFQAIHILTDMPVNFWIYFDSPCLSTLHVFCQFVLGSFTYCDMVCQLYCTYFYSLNLAALHILKAVACQIYIFWQLTPVDSAYFDSLFC